MNNTITTFKDYIGKKYSELKPISLCNNIKQNKNDGILFNINTDFNIDEALMLFINDLISNYEGIKRATPVSVIMSIPPYFNSLQVSIINSICIRLSIFKIIYRYECIMLCT